MENKQQHVIEELWDGKWRCKW